MQISLVITQNCQRCPNLELQEVPISRTMKSPKSKIVRGSNIQNYQRFQYPKLPRGSNIQNYLEVAISKTIRGSNIQNYQRFQYPQISRGIIIIIIFKRYYITFKTIGGSNIQNNEKSQYSKLFIGCSIQNYRSEVLISKTTKVPISETIRFYPQPGVAHNIASRASSNCRELYLIPLLWSRSSSQSSSHMNWPASSKVNPTVTCGRWNFPLPRHVWPSW